MALENVQPLLSIKNQTASLKRCEEEVFVEGDLVRLAQIVTNLLTNAAKYSPEQSRVWLTLECTNDDAVITVRDEGMGVDPETLPHIFDLFLQGDRSLDRSEGGLGIGLTIVRHLVDMHGGRVEARSEGVGRGSEFEVRLPRVRVSSSMSFPANGGSSPATRHARRVLVVDDNKDSAESLAMLLRLAGHTAEVTYSGAEALDRLATFEADFIFLDIGLPGMDGYMVAQVIRERFPHMRPKLFAITGYGREEDREMALKSGFDEHLTKPVEPEKLLELIYAESERRPV
jgi:CheY-like chemotaxis protein/anti-sigma regulatory factor (Ser/Thr protein kinase)